MFESHILESYMTNSYHDGEATGTVIIRFHTAFPRYPLSTSTMHGHNTHTEKEGERIRESPFRTDRKERKDRC